MWETVKVTGYWQATHVVKVVCFRQPLHMGFWTNTFLNAFPHSDTYWRKSGDDFWKHCGKRSYCSKRAISPFATKFSSFFFPVIILTIKEFFHIFSLLLQNCCMWERVDSIIKLSRKQLRFDIFLLRCFKVVCYGIF